MILFKVTKGRYSPILICDWCHQRINSPTEGNLLSVGNCRHSMIAGWMVHKNPCDKEMSNSGVLAGHSSFVNLEYVMEYLLNPRKHITFDLSIDKNAIPGVVETLQKLAKRSQ